MKSQFYIIINNKMQLKQDATVGGSTKTEKNKQKNRDNNNHNKSIINIIISLEKIEDDNN